MHVTKHHKSSLMLFVLVTLTSILDSLNGYLAMSGKTGFWSLGVIYRSSLVLLCLIVLLKMKNMKLKLYILLLAALFSLDFYLHTIMTKYSDPIFELYYMVRISFPFLFLSA